jgi:hypothetical protein
MPEIWIFLRFSLFDYDPDSNLHRYDLKKEKTSSVSSYNRRRTR